MRFIALALLLASASATAGDWTVATVTSRHLERKGQNEINPGIGIEHQVAERWRAVGGAYVNSSNVVSAYAGGVFGLVRREEVRLGLLSVLATGYDSRPVLIAGPVVSIEGRSAGVNVLFIPAGRGVIGLQVKVPWQ